MVTFAQVRNVARPLGRALFALVVAYLFIVTLLVATAQQKVVEALAAENVGYDYNVAIKYFFEPEALSRERDKNLAQLRAASKKLGELEHEHARQERMTTLSFGSLLRGLRNIADSGVCQLDLPQSVADSAGRDAALAASLDVFDCMQRPPGAGNEQLQGDGGSVLGLAGEADGAENLLQMNALAVADQRETTAALEEARAALAAQAETAAKSKSIMPVLDIFKNSRWPLVGPMVFVPPSLMAIFLAFTSGLFGALLVTLVLFVYPDDKRFVFAKSESYGARIMLGGLIALGVFVLLFSGVAVLGDSGAGDSSQNMMAYAAVGILSGMFADQAASWLSAKSVFKTDEEDNGASPRPPPPPPPETKQP